MTFTVSLGRAGLVLAALTILGSSACFDDGIDCADCGDDTEAPSPPVLELSTEVLDFGEIELGETSQRSLGVGNQGGSDLVLSGISATEPFVARYDEDITVAPSSSALLYVEITPTSADDFTGTLSFAWNDPDATGGETRVEIPTSASVTSDTGTP